MTQHLLPTTAAASQARGEEREDVHVIPVVVSRRPSAQANRRSMTDFCLWWEGTDPAPRGLTGRPQPLTMMGEAT